MGPLGLAKVIYELFLSSFTDTYFPWYTTMSWSHFLKRIKILFFLPVLVHQFNTPYQKKKNINRYINFTPGELSLGFQRKTIRKKTSPKLAFLTYTLYNRPKKVAILEHPFYPGRRNIEALTRKQNHSENIIQSVDIMMFLLCY